MDKKEEVIKTNDNEANLCDSCGWGFAECCAKNYKFGEGHGGDNVVECDQYSGTEY